MFVSCLCVSRPGRWGMLQRAILNFTAQTYADRELIIAVQDVGYAQTIESWLLTAATIPNPGNLHVINRSVHLNPAELWLNAMARAKGDVLTVWDDDNLDAPGRLTWQLERQQRIGAFTFLDESLYLFHDTQEVYFVNYQNPAAPTGERGAISTLMAPRGLWPEMLSSWREHPISEMIEDMHGTGTKLVALSGSGWRHLVGVRGDNRRGYDLHRRLATQLPHGRSRSWLMEHEAEVKEALGQYLWDYPKLTIHGKDAVAFEYEAKWRQPEMFYPVGKPDDGVIRVDEHL